MRARLLAASCMAASMLSAWPARADITVFGHYTFANGDTLSRASYYTQKQVRTTLPNGDEIIYDDREKTIMLIDHQGKRYWHGPKSQADSIATRIRSERMKTAAAAITPEQREQVSRLYSAMTDSVNVMQTDQTRKIAGYDCRLWVLTAGGLLLQERWVARALAMPDFSSECEKVVLASIADPLGSGLMTLVLQARQMDGLGLAGRIRFKTMRQQGEFSWEATGTSPTKIPPEAWQPPAGYARWEPPAESAAPAH